MMKLVLLLVVVVAVNSTMYSASWWELGAWLAVVDGPPRFRMTQQYQLPFAGAFALLQKLPLNDTHAVVSGDTFTANSTRASVIQLLNLATGNVDAVLTMPPAVEINNVGLLHRHGEILFTATEFFGAQNSSLYSWSGNAHEAASTFRTTAVRRLFCETARLWFFTPR
jgi:hypothetical protein